MDERDHKAMNEELNPPSCLGTEEQLNERMLLIEKFQKWLDTNPSKAIIAVECANIAEDYAEFKVKQKLEEMR